MDQPCPICELEEIARTNATSLRLQLQRMNPVTDPRYDGYFQGLIVEDGTRRILKENPHEAQERADA
jgi:hypothetical protein